MPEKRKPADSVVFRRLTVYQNLVCSHCFGSCARSSAPLVKRCSSCLCRERLDSLRTERREDEQEAAGVENRGCPQGRTDHRGISNTCQDGRHGPRGRCHGLGSRLREIGSPTRIPLNPIQETCVTSGPLGNATASRARKKSPAQRRIGYRSTLPEPPASQKIV